MKSARYRSRILQIDLTQPLRKGFTPPEFNRDAHELAHPPQRLVYTSKSSLDLVAGVPFYPPSGGRIANVKLCVAGAPTSTLTCDVLADGVSIFPLSPKPTILTGALFGKKAIPDISNIREDTKLQCQLTATGAGTGPLVVIMQIIEAI